MARIIRILAIVVLISILVTSALAFTIGVRQKSNIGDYLVDGKGITLYFFVNDLPKKSTCFGDCSSTWRPFYAEWIDVPKELNDQDFDQIGRIDGQYQTTYKGRPLYLYIGDHSEGDVNGNGVNGMWFAMRVH